MPFQLESNFKPRGDQEQAIVKLLKSVGAGNRHQTLLGVTGSGKTFTVANVIQKLDRPTLVISRRDVIVVASVSCIYGVTSPEDYEQMLLTVKHGQHINREAVLGRLIDMLYERNDVSFARGRFRVRGDVVEIYPAAADEEGIRIEFFGDEIEAITRFDPLTGHAHESLSVITFFPAKQFVTPADKLNRALRTIREELEARIIELESQNKLLE